MSARGKIVGRVADAAGVPLVGAKVAIAEGDQPFPDIAAVTDAEGRFCLSGLLPGSYQVEAHIQWRHGVAPVTVIAGEQAAAEIEVP